MTSDASAVLRLGRHLADALDHHDIVGRWLAHHLADLITRCEAAPEDEELSATTRKVILTLWEHKRGGSFRTDPYGYVRPVLEALARLEPNPAPWAYYRTFSDTNQPPINELAAYPLLQAACELDREAGQLIRLAVAVASREAITREEPWVIAGAALADGEEDRAVRLLEQFSRRRRFMTGDDPRSITDSGSVSLAESEALTETTESDDAPPSDAISAANRPDSDAILILALQAAVVRCKELIDQLHEIGAGLPGGPPQPRVGGT